MTCRLLTENYLFEYVESNIDEPVVWENHCHIQFEMIAVLEGDVNIMLEGKSCRLTENQIIIIPPLIYHAVTANKSGSYRRLMSLFDQSAIPEILHPYFLDKGNEHKFFRSYEAEKLMKICQKKDADFYKPLSESLMIQILYSGVQENNVSEVGESDEFLRKITSYIDEHLCGRILIDDLEKETARSKSSVCHLFEEKMNISPKQYILQKKFALASKLINDGLPMTEVAVRIGYENYSNFYRMYKKFTEP